MVVEGANDNLNNPFEQAPRQTLYFKNLSRLTQRSRQFHRKALVYGFHLHCLVTKTQNRTKLK